MIAAGAGKGASELSAIVTVDAPADLLPLLREHAATGLTRFLDYPGYLGGALHESTDGTRLVQHLRWASESEYRACIDDPRWDSLPSTHTFLASVEAGHAKMEVTLCRVVATS